MTTKTLLSPQQARRLALRGQGPLMAKDFEGPRKSAGWFDWKPAKRALEQLFMAGQLMISERRGFQKVYDLPERVLPSTVDRARPTDLELAGHLIRTTLRAHGLAQESEMRYLRRGLQKPLHQALAKGLKSGELAPVRVAGIEKLEYFAFSSDLDAVDAEHAVLQGDRFIGRMDAKADRREKTLHVLSFHPEAPPRPRRSRRDWRPMIEGKLREFAEFNACERVKLPAR